MDNVFRSYIHRDYWLRLTKMGGCEVALLCVVRMLCGPLHEYHMHIRDVAQHIRLRNTRSDAGTSISTCMASLQSKKVLKYTYEHGTYKVTLNAKWHDAMRITTAYGGKRFSTSTWCLLLAVIAHTNRVTGEARPTYEQLTTFPGLGNFGTVSKHLKLLQELGVVNVHRTKGLPGRYGNNVYTLSEDYMSNNQHKPKKKELTPNEQADKFHKLANYILEQWPEEHRTSKSRDCQAIREALARGATCTQIRTGVNAYLKYILDTGSSQFHKQLYNFLKEDFFEINWEKRTQVQMNRNKSTTTKPLTDAEKQYV